MASPRPPTRPIHVFITSPGDLAAEQRAEAHQQYAEAQTARADKLALTLAEQAAAAAQQGQVEEARQTFAKAHEGTTNLQVLYLAYEFYYRTGDLKAAEDILERWLAISGREAETDDTANAYGNLGLIYRTRGELDPAEEMHKKALAINEKLGFQEGMAAAYGNLGIIYETRGELDRAEEMLKKSLAIEEELGRQEDIAAVYSSLGLTMQAFRANISSLAALTLHAASSGSVSLSGHMARLGAHSGRPGVSS